MDDNHDNPLTAPPPVSTGISRRKLLTSLGAASLALAAGDIFTNKPTVEAAVPSSSVIYNVKDYGARGNRRYDEDDTPYIQSAIDAAALNGGIVFIPAGMYFLKLPLRIISNVTILGTGATSVLCSSAYKFSLLNITAAQHVHIHNLSFQGQGSYGGTSIPLAECGIALNQAADIRITDCSFSKIDNGIKSEDSSRVVIENNTFDSIIGTLDYDTQGYGIWCSRAVDHQIAHNHFSLLFQPCIVLTNGSRQSFIARNRMQNCYQSGIDLVGKPSEKPCEFNTISDNMFEKFTNANDNKGYTFGIRLKGFCVSNTIATNILNDIADVGIQLTGSADAKLERPHANLISHNQLRSIGGSGIAILNSYENLIQQNSINSSKADGILIASEGKGNSGAYSDHNHLTGNSFIRCSKAPIRIADAGCRENILLGNLGSGNGDQIIDKGTDTATSSL